MCSAWVLCGKEAEATTAPAICKQPARATTSATTVCSLRCPTIARSAPTQKKSTSLNRRKVVLKQKATEPLFGHAVGRGGWWKLQGEHAGGRGGKVRYKAGKDQVPGGGKQSRRLKVSWCAPRPSVRLFWTKDQFWALAPSDIRARVLSSGFFHRIPNISVLFKWLLILSKELCWDNAW